MNTYKRRCFFPLQRLVTISAIALLPIASSAFAQNITTYAFTGTVRSLNPASSLFSGVGVGSQVQGQFTVDYGAPNTTPGSGLATYQSPSILFNGLIGGHAFSLSSAAGNRIVVDDGSGPITADFLEIIGQPAQPTGLSQLKLTFHDPSGQVITGDNLPGSATAFDAFPDLALFGQSQTGQFGQYSLDVMITPVPEPSALHLGLGILPLLWLYVRSKRGR